MSPEPLITPAPLPNWFQAIGVIAVILTLVWCFFIWFMPYWTIEGIWWSFMAAGLFAKWWLRKKEVQQPAVTQSWIWDVILVASCLIGSLLPLLLRGRS
jgi:hypothetical protein